MYQKSAKIAGNRHSPDFQNKNKPLKHQLMLLLWRSCRSFFIEIATMAEYFQCMLRNSSFEIRYAALADSMEDDDKVVVIDTLASHACCIKNLKENID